MPKGFTLICPPKVETALTGFLGGIEKTHRDRLFRVEFHRSGIMCSKDGEPVTWEALPHQIRRAAHAGANMIKQANAMEQAQ